MENSENNKPDFEKDKKPGFQDKLEFISSNWAVILFLLTGLYFLIGILITREPISVFQPLEEIAARQRTYRREKEEAEFRINTSQTYIQLGNSFLDNNQIPEAEEYFELAIKTDPFSADAQEGIYKTQIFDFITNKRKKYDPAALEHKIKKQLEKKTDPHLLMYLGDSFSSWQNFPEALKYYDQALAIRPMSAAYAGKALIYDLLGKSDSAIVLYSKAIQLAQWQINYKNNLGYIYFKLGDYPMAEKFYRETLTLNSNYLLSFYTLSNTCILLDKLTEGIILKEMLLEKLNDTTVTGDRNNSNLWYFHNFLGNPVYFDNLTAKKYCAYLGLAFAYFLDGQKKLANQQLKTAAEIALPRFTKENILSVIETDIRLLEKKQKYGARPDDFRKLVTSWKALQ